MTTEPTLTRIPIAHSVVYAVRGTPEVADEYNAERAIAPHEISLTYRTTEDSQFGRVHAYVKGWWMQDGQRVPMDKPVGRHFWGRNFADWPEWLAEEARLHDPERTPVEPPADRAAPDLAKHITRAIHAKTPPADKPLDYRVGWEEALDAAIDAARAELRRKADEAQPGTETACTCADAGACFAPAGHYADCPAAVETQQDGAQR